PEGTRASVGEGARGGPDVLRAARAMQDEPDQISTTTRAWSLASVAIASPARGRDRARPRGTCSMRASGRSEDGGLFTAARAAARAARHPVATSLHPAAPPDGPLVPSK